MILALNVPYTVCIHVSVTALVTGNVRLSLCLSARVCVFLCLSCLVPSLSVCLSVCLCVCVCVCLCVSHMHGRGNSEFVVQASSLWWAKVPILPQTPKFMVKCPQGDVSSAAPGARVGYKVANVHVCAGVSFFAVCELVLSQFF